MLRTWGPWLVSAPLLGGLFAGHVDGKVLTLIFAIGVLLMSLNFIFPGVGDRVISDTMPSGVARVGDRRRARRLLRPCSASAAAPSRSW